jgi:Amt family ammonium transporter
LSIRRKASLFNKFVYFYITLPTCALKEKSMRTVRTLALSALLLSLAFCNPLAAQDPPELLPEGTELTEPNVIAEGLDTGDTAWMLVSSALVLMMTAPGLALFYGGLVRKKNILGVMMQCMFLMGLMSVVWALLGYSLAFGGDILGGFIGGFDHVLMKGVLPVWTGIGAEFPMGGGTIPTMVFMVFQGMFFIITPALICGAYAERMKFSAMVVFSVLWGLLVYCPIAHWVWSENGWLLGGEYAAFDFAGGTVVHISSGVSALICCLVMGKRLGFGQEPMPPHNLTYTYIGAAMLWVGWFGFNAGSALGANATAANAFVATHLAAAAGVLAWAGAEWITRGKPSILGACSGAVAGLVCITPACGTVNPLSGIWLGAIAGVGCFLACWKLKQKLGYDDSLDAFGVHGVGGTLGALLTGVFATHAVTGAPNPIGLIEAVLAGEAALGIHQLRNQAMSVVAAAAISVVGTFIILKILDAVIGLRVTQDDEIQGLDLSQHGEEGYIYL